jgi:hypothetical protein
LATLEIKALKFQGLDAVVTAVQVLEDSQKGVFRLGNATQGLMALQERLRTARMLVDRLLPAQKMNLPEVQSVQETHQTLLSLRKLQQRLAKSVQEVDRYAKVDHLQVSVEEGSSVRRLWDGLRVLKEFRVRLDKAAQRVATAQAELVLALEAVTAEEESFKTTLVELGQCPTCGAQT